MVKKEQHGNAPEQLCDLVVKVIRCCKTKPINEAFFAVESLLKQGLPLPLKRDVIYYLLQSCISKKDINAARKVYVLMLENGFATVAALGDHLIRFFASYGSLQEANKVFDYIVNPSIHTWHAIISAHSTCGEERYALILYYKMQLHGVMPNKFIVSCILKACTSLGDLKEGELIHNQVVKCGLDSDIFVGSSLIDMYSKCRKLQHAWKLFQALPDRNIVAWNAMIAAYVQHDQFLSALQLFEKVQQEGLKPDRATFLCAMKACSISGNEGQAKLIHDRLLKSELASDAAIGNTLVDMYSKCGNLNRAYEIFEGLETRNVISWTALIAGYVQHGDGLTAFKLFEKMQQVGIKPEIVTLLCLLKACSSLEGLKMGKLIHDQVIKNTMVLDVVFGNTLIDMYSNCGSFYEAVSIFNTLPNRTVVSWNAMLAGYVHHGLAIHTFELFEEMTLEGMEPNNVTFSCIIKACSILQVLGVGEQLHDQIIRDQLEDDTIVGNTLIDMYRKCGDIEAARKVFDGLRKPDVVSYGVVIAGYAHEGHCLRVLQLYEKLQSDGLSPDKVIFMSILKMCGDIGALSWGRLIYDHAIRWALQCDVGVGNTLIDMYSKCGSLREAREVFDRLPIKNVISWNVLIAGYAEHGLWQSAVEYAEKMQLQGLKPVSRTYKSLLTACSHSGRVAHGYTYFKCLLKEHVFTLNVEHFNCMIDLLARAGHLNDAESLLNTMPVLPDICAWMSMMTACTSFGNAALASQCFEGAATLDSAASAGYALMSNICTDDQTSTSAEKGCFYTE